MSIENAVRAACLLEATARKVGNVHPLAAFADCDWDMFAASADAIAPILGRAPGRPLGETILEAVQATKMRVGRNTNLGMILLLAPLAAVPAGPRWIVGVRHLLERTTLDDCRLLYDAIRLARPGGLGSTTTEDVAAAPTVALLQAMTLAADRDAVARQYANGFADVFSYAERLTAHDLLALERQVTALHLELIAAGLETLISRKCGSEVAAEAERKARRIIKANGNLASESAAEFDRWLRADGNRRNPGTTADLIAATLFVAIQERRIPCFDAAEISGYADGLRRTGRALPDLASR